MIKRKLPVILLGGIMAVSIFLTGCDTKSSVIPENIISKAMNANEEAVSYYAEANMQIYENDKKVYDAKTKEWYKPNNKKRSQVTDNEGNVIMTSDGEKMIIYMEKLNKVMISNKVGEDEGIFNKSPKKTVMDEFTRISETHNVEVKGEEEVNGFKTYHIIAKPKEANAIMGEANYWIDKNTWFIIKHNSIFGNTKTYTEYTKLDFNSKISDDIFTQTIPKDAEITNIDENMKTEEITIEEASKRLAAKVLYLNDNNYKLSRVETLKNTPEIGDDFNQIYSDKNGAEVFTITMKKIIEVSKNDEEIKLPNEKKITVRGKAGSSIDEKGFKSIQWQEAGLNYSIFTTAPNISIEQCKDIVEKLISSK